MERAFRVSEWPFHSTERRIDLCETGKKSCDNEDNSYNIGNFSAASAVFPSEYLFRQVLVVVGGTAPSLYQVRGWYDVTIADFRLFLSLSNCKVVQSLAQQNDKKYILFPCMVTDFFLTLHRKSVLYIE